MGFLYALKQMFYLWILGRDLFLKQRSDALTVERMETRKHIEFFVEDRTVANITKLVRLDGDVLVPLVSFLVS